MQPTIREIDRMGAGTARNFIIAGVFSLLILLATGSPALALNCIDCHNPGSGIPAPHDVACQETSCALTCHSKDLNRHPAGPGTPLAGDPATACRTCHDKPFPGVYHPYKINVSAGSITAPGAVDLDQACGQCHGGGPDAGTNPPQPGMPYFNKTVLGGFAENIHLSKPVARFSFAYDAATSYKVNFSAGSTTCPSGNCTYLWDFGDTSGESGVTVSHTYADATPRAVILTASDTVNLTSGAVSNVVTPQAANVPPVAAFAAPPAINGYQVSFTDASIDPEALPLAITVNWGDGTTSTGLGGEPYSRNYVSAGSFTIILTARDAGGLYNSTTAQVTVPAKGSISGAVFDSNGATPLLGATVTLKLSGATKATLTTSVDNNYSFGNLNPGTYTVQVYKSGMVFDGDPGAAGEQNPITVAVSSANVPGKNFTRAAFTVTVNTTPSLSGVTVYLKQNGATKATGTTPAGGAVTFTNVNPGTYQVLAVKSGKIFDGDAGATGNQNPVNVTGAAGSTQAVTFTFTP